MKFKYRRLRAGSEAEDSLGNSLDSHGSALSSDEDNNNGNEIIRLLHHWKYWFHVYIYMCEMQYFLSLLTEAVSFGVRVELLRFIILT